MPKFRTVKFSFDGAVKNELNFSTAVHVNTKGLFTTTLPAGVVVFLSANGVKTGFNRGGEKGFFSAKTFDELVEQINTLKTQYGNDKRIIEQFDNPDVHRDVANRLLTDKTIAKLMEVNKRDDKTK